MLSILSSFVSFVIQVWVLRPCLYLIYEYPLYQLKRTMSNVSPMQCTWRWKRVKEDLAQHCMSHAKNYNGQCLLLSLWK
jgi:hypothetical protein